MVASKLFAGGRKPSRRRRGGGEELPSPPPPPPEIVRSSPRGERRYERARTCRIRTAMTAVAADLDQFFIISLRAVQRPGTATTRPGRCISLCAWRSLRRAGRWRRAGQDVPPGSSGWQSSRKTVACPAS